MPITKPDKNELRRLLEKLEQADRKIAKIVEEQESHRQTVYTSYHILKDAEAERVLGEMDVSELNRDKSGIRIQTLYDHGIQTVGQLADLTPSQLAGRVSGIGEESAKKIVDRVDDLRRSSREYAKVTLDAKSTDRDMQKVLSALAFLVATAVPAKKAQAIYDEKHPLLERNLPAAKKLASSLGWLFAPKGKKQQGLEAYERLAELDADSLSRQAEEITREYQSIPRFGGGSRKAALLYEADAAAFYACLEQIIGDSKNAQTAAFLPEELAEAIDAFPIDLSLMKSTLRGYQVFGTKYILHQRRVLLGDEMGLGKTMQAIASMAHLKAAGKTHFLVVCPVSVMVNWTREVEKHSDMTAVMIHGSDRGEEYEQWIEDGGIAITTYETITKLALSEWTTVDMLVVDEAHYVKNPKAQRTQALQRIADMAEYILFMSGTPLENKVEEMQFLISLLNEEIAGRIKNLNSLEVAQAFREKIAPVYLRRVREDVLTELPEKIEKEQWCQLGAEETKAYKAALKDGGYMQVRKVSWNVDDITKSAKANRLLEICRQAQEEGRRIIVFSFFLEIIEKVQGILGERCFGPITGGVSAAERQAMIDAFSTSEPGSVLACQIIAAGTGLNIQAASVVIICEPQWKPSTETQAISRAYRMGQTQTVVVHRLLADDTVDEKIMEVLKGKTELFEEFADESAIGEQGKELLARHEREAQETGDTDRTGEGAARDAGQTTGGESGAEQVWRDEAQPEVRDIDEKRQGAYMKRIIEQERERYGISPEERPQ